MISSVLTDGSTTLEDVSYEYYKDDMLKKETHVGGPTISYEYDTRGNRTRRDDGTNNDVSTYNNRDELVETKRNSATWKQYGYDSAGRRTSLTISSAVTSYSYDHASRLTGITYPGSGGTDSMTYNGLDTRLSRTEQGTTVNYSRSGPGVTDPVLSDSGATYTPGVSERRGSTTTYQHSGLKNATTQTGTSQTVTASRKYDAFGQVLGSTGTWQGPFGYAGGFGYQSSDRSGLQLLGHRYYDPSEGRFLTPDPIKEGGNWQAYAGSNPVSIADPDGRVRLPIIVISIRALTGQQVDQPNFVNLSSNVSYAEAIGKGWRKYAWLAPVSALYLAIFVNKVKAGGDWDYKRQNTLRNSQGYPIWEPYGNWHFGVVANAFGIRRDAALRAAGALQKGSTMDDYIFGPPPYGDDSRDQYWINQGYDYYDSHYRRPNILEIVTSP